jgi:hypothetical protein
MNIGWSDIGYTLQASGLLCTGFGGILYVLFFARRNLTALSQLAAIAACLVWIVLPFQRIFYGDFLQADGKVLICMITRSFGPKAHAVNPMAFFITIPCGILFCYLCKLADDRRKKISSARK